MLGIKLEEKKQSGGQFLEEAEEYANVCGRKNRLVVFFVGIYESDIVCRDVEVEFKSYKRNLAAKVLSLKLKAS